MKIMSTLKVLIPVLLVLAWVSEVRADRDRDYHRGGYGHGGGGRSCAPAVVLRPFRPPVLVRPYCPPPVRYYTPPVYYPRYYPTSYYVPRPVIYTPPPVVYTQPQVVVQQPQVVYQQPVYVPPPPPVDYLSLGQSEFVRRYPALASASISVLKQEVDDDEVEIHFRATWQEVLSTTTHPDGRVTQNVVTKTKDFKIEIEDGKVEYDD